MRKLEDLKFRCISYLLLFFILFWFMIIAIQIEIILGLFLALIEIYILNSYRIYRKKAKDLAKKLGVSLPWWF